MLDARVQAREEQVRVEGEVRRARGLVEVDVAPTTVVGGEVEDHVDPADGPTSQPLVQEVALEELDVEIVQVLGAPGREVVDHPDGGPRSSSASTRWEPMNDAPPSPAFVY